MTIYCYRKPSGEVVDMDFPFGKAPATVEVDGETCTRDLRAELTGGGKPKGWPMTCYASGVHPDQAGELSSFLSKAGIPTEVTRDGDPVYTSKQHRDQCLRARGFHDKQAFY